MSLCGFEDKAVDGPATPAEFPYLSAMTQEASWQAFQNPDYTQFSANFRAHANALTKAAKEKNVDAATLAYVRMTMSCVDCHKLVRGRVVAQMPLGPRQFARQWPVSLPRASAKFAELMPMVGEHRLSRSERFDTADRRGRNEDIND